MATPIVKTLAVVPFVLFALLGACAAQKGTIGAVLGQDSEGRLFVRDVPPGLAADRAELHPGDEILLIDGHDARAMGARGVHEALEGKVGEPVKLTLVREGQVIRVTLKRTPAKKHPVAGDAVPPKNP